MIAREFGVVLPHAIKIIRVKTSLRCYKKDLKFHDKKQRFIYNVTNWTRFVNDDESYFELSDYKLSGQS